MKLRTALKLLDWKLKILAHDVQVIYPYKFVERTDVGGQYDSENKIIRISSVDENGDKLPESTIWVRFLHECLHAVDRASGYNLFDENHEACYAFSEIVYAMLKDNGAL